MKKNTTLTSLELYCKEEEKIKERERKERKEWMAGNKIGVEGAKAMNEMLKVNTTLTFLDLRSEEEKKERKRERKEIKEEDE